MRLKENNKEKALRLRAEGLTYTEILDLVPVAKSTLSLWLREVGLSKRQIQRITEKKIYAQKRGAQAQKNKRIRKQHDLIENAQNEIGTMTKREIWLIGIALYWAEGSKEKEGRPGSQASFSNSDPRMVALFIRWLEECIRIRPEDIHGDLYIHESHRQNIDKVLEVWGKNLNKPRYFFRAVYLKRNKIGSKRRNTGILYIGLIRVTIRASSDLNRRIV